MKNLIVALSLLSILSMLSCTKTIYTHEQMLSSYQTKQDVVKKFGMPTEKKVNEDTEMWLYRFDRKDSFTKHSVDEYQNVQTVTVADFTRYKRYLLFTFDQKGNVVRSDFKDVDLAVKKKDTAATIVLIATGVGIVFGATALLSSGLADVASYQ